MAPNPHRHRLAAPISPRRQKLSLRMKSFSLDSPESSEQADLRSRQQQQHPHRAAHRDPGTRYPGSAASSLASSVASSSHTQCTQAASPPSHTSGCTAPLYVLNAK